MKAWLGLGVAALLLACSEPSVEDVQQKYTSRVRQLGLIPVYPPREGVQVGDIFISSNVPGNDAKTVRFAVASVPDMLTQAERTLRGRVVFDPSRAKDAKSQPDVDSTEFQGDFTSGNLRTRGENGATNISLPIEVFPEVTADAGSSLNFGILAPFMANGLFAGTRTSVTLNFNDVRSYWVDPLDVTLAANVALCGVMGLDNPAGIKARNILARAVEERDAGTGLAPQRRREAYTVITKVYLTRSITYTYRNAKLLAAARQALTADGKPVQAGAGGVTVNILPPFADGKSAAPATATINEAVASAKSGTDGTSFVSFTALGLSINRTFKQPVVIAYEGLSYPTTADEALKKSCATPSTGPMPGARPTDSSKSAPAARGASAKTE